MRFLLVLSLFPLAALSAPLVLNITNKDTLTKDEREWRKEAIAKLWAEREAMGHTTLRKYHTGSTLSKAQIYIKDETETASGTLKHRFVWALILWAVTEGKINSASTVYDSTSGNTGASEAYMCRLIGVPYVAVVAKELEEEKVKQITQFGGQILKVKVSERNFWAEKKAKETGGFFINQFGNADAAEEFHESGNFTKESSNVFHEIMYQMDNMTGRAPDYFVHSAGTGGTISSVGKYIARYSIPTKVVLADSQYSLFYDYVLTNKYSNISAGQPGRPAWVSPGIAGIGYGYNTAPIIFKNTTSLARNVIHEVVKVPDIVTVAGMRYLADNGIDAGASTALNFLVALWKSLGVAKKDNGDETSIVIIMGDPGRFYKSTYLNDTWINEKFSSNGVMKMNCWKKKIAQSIIDGTDFMTNPTECLCN